MLWGTAWDLRGRGQSQRLQQPPRASKDSDSSGLTFKASLQNEDLCDCTLANDKYGMGDG